MRTDWLLNDDGVLNGGSDWFSRIWAKSEMEELLIYIYSVAVVSSVVVMSSHLITNRMRFYFFQSKCVVNVSSACHFPTRGGMQCKIVRLSLSFPHSKFENFMGYSCFMGLSLMPFGTLRIVERLIFLLRF